MALTSYILRYRYRVQSIGISSYYLTLASILRYPGLSVKWSIIIHVSVPDGFDLEYNGLNNVITVECDREICCSEEVMIYTNAMNNNSIQSTLQR